MRHPIRSAALVAVLAIMVAFPTAAWAAGPSTAPQPFISQGFETLPFPSYLTLTPVNGLETTSPAYWGRITQVKRTGSYGLWCAGSVVTPPSPNGWTLFAQKYPVELLTLATFNVTSTTDFYSSSVEAYYIMPSKGPNDGFLAYSTTGGMNDRREPPVSAVWSAVRWSLSATSSPALMSRRPGVVEFQMMDNPFDTPANGQGPTIDDVTISGFKFGPVRSLSATESAGQVVLDWQKPWRSTDATSVEERPVAYRVWRSPETSPAVWTELTTTRTLDVTFTDAAPPTGYQLYVVQAWDPGTGTGYGQVSVPADAVRIGIGAVPPTTSHVIAPSSPDGSNGWYVTTPTVSISRDMTGTTYFGVYGQATSTYVSSSLSPHAFTLSPGAVTYGYLGVGSGGATETLVHPVTVKVDTRAPVTTPTVSVAATYTGVAAITLAASDPTPGSGVAGTRWSIDGGVATSGTAATTSLAGTRTLTWSSIDVAGNRETTKSATFFVTATSPTSITIRTTATSVRTGAIPILSGAVTPLGMIGRNIVVWVKKPGRAYFSYSSNRTVYNLGGNAVWQYKYYFKPGMVKGYYVFKASAPAPGFASSAGFLTSNSPTTVTIRLR